MSAGKVCSSLYVAPVLGEKDKFAVAVRLIVVGSSRLFLLANLFWTYSDQPILGPTNLFPEFEFTCTKILVFVFHLLVCFSSSILSLLYTCCLPQARKTNSKSKTFGIVLMFFLSYDNPDTMFGLHLHTLPPRSSDDCFKDARNTFASKARSQNYSVSISLAVFHASFSWPHSTKQHILFKFKVRWY